MFDEKFVIVSSADSPNYLPSNTPNSFSSVIVPPIQLDGDWVIGLSEIFIEFESLENTEVTGSGGHVIFDVYLSQVTGSVLGGCESNLLRRVIAFTANKRCKSVYANFENYYMLPLRSSSLNKLDFFIKQVKPENSSLAVNSHTRATLVLKRVRSQRV